MGFGVHSCQPICGVQRDPNHIAIWIGRKTARCFVSRRRTVLARSHGSATLPIDLCDLGHLQRLEIDDRHFACSAVDLQKTVESGIGRPHIVIPVDCIAIGSPASTIGATQSVRGGRSFVVCVLACGRIELDHAVQGRRPRIALRIDIQGSAHRRSHAGWPTEFLEVAVARVVHDEVAVPGRPHASDTVDDDAMGGDGLPVFSLERVIGDLACTRVQFGERPVGHQVVCHPDIAGSVEPHIVGGPADKTRRRTH